MRRILLGVVALVGVSLLASSASAAPGSRHGRHYPAYARPPVHRHHAHHRPPHVEVCPPYHRPHYNYHRGPAVSPYAYPPVYGYGPYSRGGISINGRHFGLHFDF